MFTLFVQWLGLARSMTVTIPPAGELTAPDALLIVAHHFGALSKHQLLYCRWPGARLVPSLSVDVFLQTGAGAPVRPQESVNGQVV
jgi:hypothetical protein